MAPSKGINLELFATAISRMAFAVCSSLARRNDWGAIVQSEVFFGQQISKSETAAAQMSPANVTRTWQGSLQELF